MRVKNLNRRDFLTLTFFVVLLASIVITSSNSLAHVIPNGDNIWLWLTQSQKDSAIVNEALKWVGNWGGQCKEWIQVRVVLPASHGHVLLPLNNSAPYDWYWQSDPTGHAVGFTTYIEWVGHGDIIQMRLSNGIPHTMIVVWNTGAGIWVVDSNSRGDEKVRYYFLTFDQFRNRLEKPWSFSVYYVR